MEWLTLFIYILIIFFNIFFDKFIPYANYTDELICLLFMAIAIVYICKDKGKVAVNKEQKNSILCILLRVYFSHTGISLLFIRYPLSHVSCHTGYRG